MQVKGSDIKGSRQDSAIKSYEAALSIPDPTDNYGINHAKIMLKLADAYMKFEQPHKALHYFSRCITTTTDTSTQLMKIAKGQRLNSPLHWIEINGNSRLKADFEDEFVGVDQHIHDTILTIRELTAECGRGLNKIPPGQASIENDPRFQSLKRHVMAEQKRQQEQREQHNNDNDDNNNNNHNNGNDKTNKKKRSKKGANNEL